MEKKQYKLCIEVLKRFQAHGILPHVVLIGSWCLPLYKEYFKNTEYNFSFRTRDIDFLVPRSAQIRKKVDVVQLLGDLGFIIGRSYPAGYMRLQHPDLIIEFLVPEKGKGSDMPFPVPQLGVNAQSLRFLDILSEHTIHVEIEGLLVTLPDPVYFALQKLIISGRRAKKEKSEKDVVAAVSLLTALIQMGKKEAIKKALNALPQKWQKLALKALAHEADILA